MTEASTAEGTADREIVQERIFDAPPALVFKAWTEPEHFARWMGPNGFTTTVHSMEARPGGVCRFTMRGPDGVEYKNRISYREIVEPERLVYLHDGDDEDEAPPFHVTVTFVEEGGKTRLTMRSLFASAAERDRVADFGAIELGKQTLERLAEYLATMEQ